MSRFTILGLAAVLGIVAAALATAGSHAPDQIVSPPSTPPPSPEASGSFRVGQTIDLGITPQSVAAGLGSVWVAGVQDVYRTESQLLRVDPTTHSITRLPTKFSQCGSFDEWHTFGVGFESIWVPDCARSTLLRVNPQTGAIEATFTGVTRKASNEPESIVAFDASAAWRYAWSVSRSLTSSRIRSSDRL